MDIRENLVALGSTPNFCCRCHTYSHNAHTGNNLRPNRADLLEIAAKREGTTPEAITEKVQRLRAETKVKTWVVS